jgi:hypothetical protein
VKSECLSNLVLLSERGLRRALFEFVEHYHPERNHQGKGNVILFPQQNQSSANAEAEKSIKCKERLGGLLKFYYKEAA